jgi:orotate phosphoribosyltransferase
MTDSDDPIVAQLLDLLDGRRGHFLFESGHHGELWLNLDALFLRPATLGPIVGELGRRILRATPRIDALCGPLVGGALIAQMIAESHGVELYFTEPKAGEADAEGLYPVRYRVPDAVRGTLAGKTVAVVDDAVNAGSATRATVAELRDAGADVVAIGALIVFGNRAADYARRERFVLEHVAQLENHIWAPGECPLCRAGEALEDVRTNPGATG